MAVNFDVAKLLTIMEGFAFLMGGVCGVVFAWLVVLPPEVAIKLGC